MKKVEIRHFKSLLREGSLRHMNILLDDKFQSELINIIKGYELLEKENEILKENAENNDKVVDKVNWENQLLKKENQQLKYNWNKLKEYISIKLYNTEYLQKLCGCGIDDFDHILLDVIREEMKKLEEGSDSNDC